jgi:hypothetical protein
MLQGPESELNSASRLAADFIHRTWLEVSDETDRFQLIDLVTNSLLTGRDREHAMSLLRAAIKTRFSSYQRPVAVILARVEVCGQLQSDADGQEESSSPRAGL